MIKREGGRMRDLGTVWNCIKTRAVCQKITINFKIMGQIPKLDMKIKMKFTALKI